MSLQPADPLIPVPIGEAPAAIYFRTSDDTVCIKPIGPHPTQKDSKAGTKEVADDPEVSSSEDEFPDGGLRAWAVVLGVGSWIFSKGRTDATIGRILHSDDFRLRECVGGTRKRLVLRR